MSILLWWFYQASALHQELEEQSGFTQEQQETQLRSDWAESDYDEIKEHDAPQPLGHYVTITPYVDENLIHSLTYYGERRTVIFKIKIKMPLWLVLQEASNYQDSYLWIWFRCWAKKKLLIEETHSDTLEHPSVTRATCLETMDWLLMAQRKSRPSFIHLTCKDLLLREDGEC